MADYYEILRLRPNATPEQVVFAYRDLAKRSHPDKDPLPDAEVRFKEINQAYECLNDPERRAQYDARLRAEGRAHAARAAAARRWADRSSQSEDPQDPERAIKAQSVRADAQTGSYIWNPTIPTQSSPPNDSTGMHLLLLYIGFAAAFGGAIGVGLFMASVFITDGRAAITGSPATNARILLAMLIGIAAVLTRFGRHPYAGMPLMLIGIAAIGISLSVEMNYASGAGELAAVGLLFLLFAFVAIPFGASRLGSR